MSGAGELKVATRAAIDDCKGIEKAAAVAGRAVSTAGLWNNLHKPDLPPVDCALAVDALATANGGVPSITIAMARALGMVLITPPEGQATQASLLSLMGDFAGVSGSLHREFCIAQADGSISPKEKTALLDLIATAQTELAEIKAALTQGEK